MVQSKCGGRWVEGFVDPEEEVRREKESVQSDDRGEVGVTVSEPGRLVEQSEPHNVGGWTR